MKINQNIIDKYTPSIEKALGKKAAPVFRWVDHTEKVFMVSVKDKHALMTEHEVISTGKGRWRVEVRDQFFNDYSFYVNVPIDCENPQWDYDYPVGDWKGGVDKQLRSIWGTLSTDARRAIAGNIKELAETILSHVEDASGVDAQ